LAAISTPEPCNCGRRSRQPDSADRGHADERPGRGPGVPRPRERSVPFPWMRKQGLGPGRLSPVVHCERLALDHRDARSDAKAAASACALRARPTWTQRPSQAPLHARRPHAQAVVCQAPSAAAGRQGWAVSPGSAARATSQLRAEWLARARHERLALSARPSLPGNRPDTYGRGPLSMSSRR
jgi:hypothetical protein